MAVKNYCLLNRFKIPWPRWSITVKGRVDTNRPNLTSNFLPGAAKSVTMAIAVRSKMTMLVRRRDYQDDKETPDSGSPKLDAEIVIGGAAEVKPLKR